MSYPDRDRYIKIVPPLAGSQGGPTGVPYGTTSTQHPQVPALQDAVSFRSCNLVSPDPGTAGNGHGPADVLRQHASLHTSTCSTASTAPQEHLGKPHDTSNSKSARKNTTAGTSQVVLPTRLRNRAASAPTPHAQLANWKWPDGITRLHVNIFKGTGMEKHSFDWPIDELGNRKALDLEQMYELAELMKKLPVQTIIDGQP